MRGFCALLESFGVLVKSVSAIGRLSREGDLWSGTVRAQTRARPVFFGVTDFGKRCNEKEAKTEETNFVKWVLYIVRCGLIVFGCMPAALRCKTCFKTAIAS